MLTQVCLFCLQVFRDGDKFPETIRLETLLKLLTLCHHNYKSLNSEHEFDGDEMFDLCGDCYPIISTMGQIRRKISILDEEIGSKIEQIQATILHTSSSPQLQSNARDKILQIRDKFFLRVPGLVFSKIQFITSHFKYN